VKPALAVLSGVLLALCFPKFTLVLVAFIALFPLMLAIRLPGAPPETTARPWLAFRLGYLTGAVFFLILLYWIPDLPPENVTVPYLMYPALGIMVAYLALFPALSAMAAAWLSRRGVSPGLSLPLAWTLTEALRGTGTFGFPWGSLGYAFAPFPHLIQFASITGIWGVTLWAALVSGLVYLYLSLPWVRPKLVGFTFLAAAILLPYLHGQSVLNHRRPRAGVKVGVVQPNVGNNKWKMAVRDSVSHALVDQTAALARANEDDPPSLIIWPETAIPARLPREPYYRYLVEHMVDTTGVPLLAGFPDGVRLENGTVRFTNSAALILPHRGMVARYDKQHLVPFSEFFPLPILNRFGQSNFTPGTKPGIMKENGVPFGVLICFESIFPGMARELTDLGARYLINITNDQWFGNSAAPDQHFNMNVLRAIESRVGLVRAANTGISGIIDPYGLVVRRTDTFVKTSFVGVVELGDGPTFYDRHGNWVLYVAGGFLLLFGVYALTRRRWT
jgi:apolipoprotein N-acyltransferase